MTDSLSDIPSSGASDELKTTKTRSLSPGVTGEFVAVENGL